MSAFGELLASPRPTQAVAGRRELLASRLDRLEVQIYVSLDGIAAAAADVREDADRAGAHALAWRAELLRSDALSRAGALQDALALQTPFAVQAQNPDTQARAHCLLASTYYRLGMLAEARDSAAQSVSLLTTDSPAHWHTEHFMVLALFTSYERAGSVDFGLFEESLRRARDHADPELLLAVLNNFAWTRAQYPDNRETAAELAQEMRSLIDSGVAAPSAPVLDTIAWIDHLHGDTAAAERLLIEAMAAPSVEPDDFAALSEHLAAVRRAQDRPAEAAALLERARAIAVARQTPEVAISALRALAEIDAAGGDHRRAYRRLRRFVEERQRYDRTESEQRALALQMIHGVEIERRQREHFEQLAQRDPLTGLPNRRIIESTLPQMLRCTGVAVAIIDIDWFKRVNDRFSHETGDTVLQQIAHTLGEHQRAWHPNGFTARLGGEEFLICAPGQTLADAGVALEALRSEIAHTRFTQLPPGYVLTVSIGAVVTDSFDWTPRDALAAADCHLYDAKRAGRNRIVLTGS